MNVHGSGSGSAEVLNYKRCIPYIHLRFFQFTIWFGVTYSENTHTHASNLKKKNTLLSIRLNSGNAFYHLSFSFLFKY